ncbi:MAG: hypothetical protein RL114_785 [Actinomycetota bacterium]|jgi:pyruvate carboxylase
MRDGCRRKEKEEVTNFFLSIHRAVWRKVNSTVSDVKKQAPAARMVGEFAVKHVANEANKNIRKVTDPSPPASE